MQRYAPDTNFFLQFKPPEEVPWAELTDANDIELIVLAEVLGELDKHKNGGNTRRATRSRNTLQRLRPLIVTGQETIEVRKQGPRVVYRLAPDLPAERTKPTTLDTSTADGKIIEEALACKATMGDLALLTHDSLPMLTARRHGLPVAPLPDTWRLPPERDAKDKEIASLKEELAAWTARAPKIDVQMQVHGEYVDRIEGNLTRYAPLSQQFLEKAMQAVEVRHPDETVRIPGRLAISREADRERYEHERAEWVAKVRDHLGRYPNTLNRGDSVFALMLTLQNLGLASAESLVVEVFAEGNIRLVRPDDMTQFLERQKFGLPQPPRMRSLMDLADPLGIRISTPNLAQVRSVDTRRDTPPRDFYWQFDSPGVLSQCLEGACTDFRHQFHKEETELVLSVPMAFTDEPVGCIRIRYSAKNLVQPVEAVWPVRLVYDWRDTEAKTIRFLKDQLDVNLF